MKKTKTIEAILVDDHIYYNDRWYKADPPINNTIREV